MVTDYIEPRFILTNSYSKLQEHGNDDFGFLVRRDSEVIQVNLTNILERPLLFIVAEPGHGKTRLVKELSKRAGDGAVRIDFKTKVDDRPVGDWLNTNGVSESTKTILLDGLDEAPAKYIQSTIFSLVEFIRMHPKTKFYISCRVHYFAKYQSDFSMLPTAEFLFIKPLERSRARQLLLSVGVPGGAVATLFTSLSRSDGTTILQNPRYLEMIAKEINSGRIDVLSLNRAALFESFVLGALVVEDGKNGRQLAEYKKRMLELLALTMEVAQCNQISTDDFVTFMERATSDVKLIVAQVDIENIYEHSLLVKDLDSNISFTNREIQEYLAARYILRMANPQYKVFSLAIEPQLRDIIPSWRNTLSYIIDELPVVARHIIDLSPNRMTLDAGTALLVTGSTSGKMSSEDEEYVFDYIWQQYNRQENFIHQELSFNLANYASEDYTLVVLKKLKALLYTADREYSTTSLNVVNLCGYLLSLNRFESAERDKVIEKLVRIALYCPSTTMKINSLSALMSVHEMNLLQQLSVLAGTSDSSVFSYIERLAYEVAPESELAIDIYVNGIKRDAYYGVRAGIETLQTAEAIGYFLGKLASDVELIKSIIDHDRLFAEDRSEFLQNLKDVWQDGWLPQLKTFIKNAFKIEYGFYAEKSKFVEQIIRLIAEHDEMYYMEFLISGLQNHNLLVRIDSSLAKIIQPSDVVHTVDAVKQLDDKGFLVFRIFSYLQTSERPEKDEILHAARNHLPDYFNEHDIQIAEFKRRRKYNSTTAKFNREYAKITDDVLTSALWGTSATIIDHLDDTRQNQEALNYTDIQVKRIWGLLRNLILAKFDPADIQLSITKRDAGNTSYSITRTAEWFEQAFVFGYLTKRPDLHKYKDKLLAYFPYMRFHGKKDLFGGLQLSAQDYQKIIQAYQDISADNAQYQAYDFVEFVAESRNVSAVCILQKFVLDEHTQDYVREYALKTVENLAPSKEFLLKVNELSHQKTDTASAKLIRSADDLLITNYAHKPAILRRIAQIKDAASMVPPRRVGGSYEVTDIESELHDKTLAKPLMGLHDQLYFDDFLGLLGYSFTINQESSGWSRYAQYLWEVTAQYFENVVADQKNNDVLRCIEKVVEQYPALVTANYLRFFGVIQSKLFEIAGTKRPYIEAINSVNAMNSTETITITSDLELLYSTKEVISELDRWVTQEGDTFLADKGRETDTQKRLSQQFENILNRKYGVSNVRPRIDRETQAVDGTRTDFYVYYGFYGPVIVELKLSSHPDIAGKMETKESFKSMQKYMKEFGASYGILLIHRTKDVEIKSFARKITAAQTAYGSIGGVEVMGIG